MTPNNPPHACESCGSQVEFPGLIYCARCQTAKARRAAEVQAAADAISSGTDILKHHPDGSVERIDPATVFQHQPHDAIRYLIERYEAEIRSEWEGTSQLEAKLEPAKSAFEHYTRITSAAPVSTAAATTASESGELAECVECDGQGCRHYPDGEWQGKCDGCKGTGIDNRATDGQQGASRAVESPEQQEITLQLALQKLRREHPELVHSDQRAVRKFADAMEAKMAVSRGRGRSGWQMCSVPRLHGMLLEHLRKGDPVDVANFCMMLWDRGAKVAAK